MTEALQPLQRALRTQTQVTPLVQPRLPHPSRALPRHSSIRRREGHGRINSSVTVRGSGEEMPTSPVERLVGFSSRRVEAVSNHLLTSSGHTHSTF